MTGAANPLIQSGINTLRNWAVRRQAKGKNVTREDILVHIKLLWPQMEDCDAALIADGVLR